MGVLTDRQLAIGGIREGLNALLISAGSLNALCQQAAGVVDVRDGDQAVGWVLGVVAARAAFGEDPAAVVVGISGPPGKARVGDAGGSDLAP